VRDGDVVQRVDGLDDRGYGIAVDIACRVVSSSAVGVIWKYSTRRRP
jgi:hypothetical protein